MDLQVTPYPADTLAKGWRFEVDMEKVKRSDTWVRAKTGEIRGALLLLWGESWQQTPCGTLPDDDELVALIIDMPLPKFKKNRGILMRGWWLAEDGRLYHETITERVLAMLEKRAKDAERSANRRARQAGAPIDPPVVTDASRVTPAGLHGEFDTKHQAPSTSPSLRSGEARGSRLPKPFDLPDVYRTFCIQERPDLNPDAVAEKFADYWHGKPGKAGTKVDWLATWRNWVREERAPAAARTGTAFEPAWRAEQRQRTQQAVPGIAARDTTNVIELEAHDVAPRRLG